MKRIPIVQAIRVQKIAEARAVRKRWRKNKLKRKREMRARMVRKVRHDYKDWKQLELPDNFCLADNYKQVVSAISQLRARIGKNRYINFNAIRQVDTAAALMLAAELEVGKIEAGAHKMTAHDADWNPKVRTLLGQMGFLELLSADSEMPSRTEPSKNQIFIKFRSGHKLIGDGTMQMLESLQKHIAPYELEPELLLHLYVGIFEAITNTRHHAYKKKNPDEELNEKEKLEEELKRWWISASVNTETNEIKIVCYDRGATIPKTIQASKEKSNALASFLKDVLERSPDGQIILAAISQKRSSTKLANRGKGLSELLRLIERNKQGSLRIYSGEGLAEFHLSTQNEKNSDIFRKLPLKMKGTLVEWSIIPSRSTMETH